MLYPMIFQIRPNQYDSNLDVICIFNDIKAIKSALSRCINFIEKSEEYGGFPSTKESKLRNSNDYIISFSISFSSTSNMNNYLKSVGITWL